MSFISFKKLAPFRKNIISAILGIVFLVYFIVISMYWGRIDSFNKVMIVIGLLWIIISIKIDKIFGAIRKLPKIITMLFKIVLILFIVSFIIIESIIMYNMKTTLITEADYIIVLGCQVNGLIPSIPLMRRVNVAVRYLQENKNVNVVISGGKGPGENISEAEAMKRILLRNGIDENRIFEENKSKSTMENFKFSDELYSLSDKNIIVVTSDYHIFRAVSMAKKLNYKYVKGLPSKSQLSVLPVYILREYAAVLYYILLGRI
jgi:uncharacterized SAM-binding protein YcdF (DUF218 family)